jgi:hypothetical protein
MDAEIGLISRNTEQMCILKCAGRVRPWEWVRGTENRAYEYKIQTGVRKECSGTKQVIIGKYRGKQK